MQANDTALDAIEEQRLKQIIKKKDKKALQKMLSKVSELGILGIAEYVLDAGVPHTFLDTCRPTIDEALRKEKTEERLECWTNPEERRRALNLFKKRLQGKKVDQKELEKSNEGLMSKMLQTLSDNSGEGWV